MKKISFNKLRTSATCLFCNKTKISIKDWDKRCIECKKKKSAKVESHGVKIGSRVPAAVVENEETGNKVFVDKFGKEVHNHGYSLDIDPRGLKRNKRDSQTKRTLI